jgi:hypothetical protein
MCPHIQPRDHLRTTEQQPLFKTHTHTTSGIGKLLPAFSALTIAMISPLQYTHHTQTGPSKRRSSCQTLIFLTPITPADPSRRPPRKKYLYPDLSWNDRLERKLHPEKQASNQLAILVAASPGGPIAQTQDSSSIRYQERKANAEPVQRKPLLSVSSRWEPFSRPRSRVQLSPQPPLSPCLEEATATKPLNLTAEGANEVSVSAVSLPEVRGYNEHRYRRPNHQLPEAGDCTRPRRSPCQNHRQAENPRQGETDYPPGLVYTHPRIPNPSPGRAASQETASSTSPPSIPCGNTSSAKPSLTGEHSHRAVRTGQPHQS